MRFFGYGKWHHADITPGVAARMCPVHIVKFWKDCFAFLIVYHSYFFFLLPLVGVIDNVDNIINYNDTNM